MGTSGSFGGSGGKDASDLRDNIAEWLDGLDDLPESPESVDEANDEQPDYTEHPQLDLGPAIRLLLRPRGQSAGSGGSSATPSVEGGAGRSSGGPVRSVGRVSQAASRAGTLALAYSSGNREALSEAGLDYDELRALDDPLAVGIKIVEAAFDSRATSTIEDDEERNIIAGLVDWILEYPDNQNLSPEDVVRKSIEITIAEVYLTEASAALYTKRASPEERRILERQIWNLAAELANQARLTPSGATTQDIAQAIEFGIRDIGLIFGVES